MDFANKSNEDNLKDKNNNGEIDSRKSYLSDEQAEWQHWYDIMRTFLLYEDFCEMDIRRRQDHLNRLSEDYLSRLPSSTFSKIDSIVQASKMNQKLFHEIVDFQDFGFGPRDRTTPFPKKYDGKKIPYSQMHKNQAVLHSLVREWSSEGALERAASFDPLMEELQLRLPVTRDNAYQQRVLVPGCGLARLAVEIVSRGYSCQANEFSMFMLTASHLILNGGHREDEIEICPWIDK